MYIGDDFCTVVAEDEETAIENVKLNIKKFGKLI